LRIRTIKPAFWKNEALASLDKSDRLLAVALLNYADDQGYFCAHESLIRGECFPFDEDSSDIRRGLGELSRIGFIRLGTTPEGQKIGQIVTFSDHQKIDRPTKSKYSDASVTWNESTKIRRALVEDSLLEKEEEREEEGSRAVAKSRPQRSPKGARLSKDWQLTTEQIEWAIGAHPGWKAEDVLRVAEVFREYWLSVAGAKGVKQDWDATWRNWVRREHQKHPARAAPRDEFAGAV